MPIACRIATSCANDGSLPAAISSPAIATTKVLPWYAWIYGATVRNHGTKVCGKTRFTGGVRGRATRARPAAAAILAREGAGGSVPGEPVGARRHRRPPVARRGVREARCVADRDEAAEARVARLHARGEVGPRRGEAALEPAERTQPQRG